MLWFAEGLDAAKFSARWIVSSGMGSGCGSIVAWLVRPSLALIGLGFARSMRGC